MGKLSQGLLGLLLPHCYCADLLLTSNCHKKDFIFLFLGRGEGREKHQSVASHTPPTEDLVHNSGICPDWEPNRPPLGLQDNAQPTEPHQSEQQLLFTEHLLHWQMVGSSTQPYRVVFNPALQGGDLYISIIKFNLLAILFLIIKSN